MKISDILRHKGSAVVTVTTDETVSQVLAKLAEHNIGALVVVRDNTPAGIVSERDIVRRLNERGAAAMQAKVTDVMTAAVVTCSPQDAVDSVAATMTERRIRHMPVIEGDALAGIVSIGDVVLSRIRQLEHDRGQLEQYITG